MLHYYLVQNLAVAACVAFMSWFCFRAYKITKQNDNPLVKLFGDFLLLLFVASFLFSAVSFGWACLIAEELVGLWAYGDYFLETHVCTVVVLVQRDFGPDYLYCDGSRYLWVYGERETIMARRTIEQASELSIGHLPTTNIAVSLTSQFQDKEQDVQVSLSPRRVATYFLVRHAPTMFPFVIFSLFSDDILDKALPYVSVQRRRIISIVLVAVLGVVMGFLFLPVLVLDSVVALVWGDSYPQQKICQVVAPEGGKLEKDEYLRCSDGTSFWLFYPDRLRILALQIANNPKLTVKYFPLSDFVVGISVSR